MIARAGSCRCPLLRLLTRRGGFRWSIFVLALGGLARLSTALYLIPHVIGQLVFKPEPQLEVAVIDEDDLEVLQEEQQPELHQGEEG